MKANIENKLLAVVRVRGRIGVRGDIRETLERMNLKRVNNLVLIFGTKSYIGMINKCNAFVTYGEVSAESIAKLAAKGESKASKDDVDAMMAGKKSAADVLDLPIGLKPPKHGYEGTKKSFSKKGAVGYRGAEINALITRMT